MFKSGPLSSRGQFGDFLTLRGLTGTAVEIGTHRGEFAEALMRTWPDGKKLYCVDPWACPPGYDEQLKFLWPEGATQAEALDEARRALKRYGDRVEFLRMTSHEACPRFLDGTVDFIYIDGDHRYEQVMMDLCRWWDKLKPGGIMAGHDYIQPGEGHSWAGEVQRAVHQFTTRFQKVDVELIVEERGLPWSYFMVKQ